MTDMHDFDSAEPTKLGLITQVLTWTGILLLLVSGLLAYPYVHSRLTVLSPTPALAPSFSSSATPTIASAAPTSTPTPPLTSHRGVGPYGPTPYGTLPTFPHTPTSTPIPALPIRIVIPVISVDAPVVPVSWRALEVGGQTQTTWEVPDMYAAGWHETSSSPGIPGNVVLNGHNTTNGEVFRDLYTLEDGDVIIVYADSTPYTYTVTKVLILPEADQPLEVRQENARYILPTDDERLTLVTCHPYGSLRNRLIVIAHPVTAEGSE